MSTDSNAEGNATGEPTGSSSGREASPRRRGPLFFAGMVLATAVLAAKQPLLSRMHCLYGLEALSMLDDLVVSWAFICRSPEYATQATDAAFAELKRAAG